MCYMIVLRDEGLTEVSDLP